MSNIITLTGTVALIKNERHFQHTNTKMVEFILSIPDEKKPQHHIIRALSKDSQKDKFKIESLLGHEVEVECWLNGRKSESDKGPFYTNDLNLKSIVTI